MEPLRELPHKLEVESRELARTISSQNQKSWIEKTFYKRECCKFIKSPRDSSKCCCGRHSSHHASVPHSLEEPGGNERWHPYGHTEAQPTDAYGTIEFQGAPHPSKAQYVRLSSFDTKAEHVLQLLQRHWGLNLPKLLITVHGGILNFDLQPKLKRVFRKGLLKAAKTTGAWIITGGTNTGVTRHVGDAISDRTTKTKNKVVAIGIAPWGIVENKEDLLGRDIVVPYHCVSSPKTNSAVLNSNHSYFLLVDNGTIGKYGGEIIFRKRLERFIAQQKISIASGVKGRGVPVICVVLEGGANTIRSVLEYVTDTPPVPVVVCDGSGRAADLLAFTHKYTLEDGTMPEGLRDQLVLTIQKTFQYTQEQAEKLFIELMLCVKKRELITVFRMGEGAQDIDLAILTALLKGTNANAPDQLSLALTWDRVDIARSHIFVYGQEWPEGSLEQSMMDALINDRVDFVKLLLENGVSMHTFLTIPRLEELYNTRQGPSNTLRYLIRDIKKNIPTGYRYTLLDIGLVLEHLMGGAFRSTYCRKKFRQKYHALKRNGTAGNLQSMVTAVPLMIDTKANELFQYPFHDLMIWAVLMKRQKMALFMWQHGEEAMAKSLLACKLYKAMAQEAEEDDLEVDISDELMKYAKEFQTNALELLEHCYKIDDDYTMQLLTYELKNFSDQTCLSLAVQAVHKEFLAHTCCQILINDMWMGGLQMRKNSNLKVLMGLLLPPYIICLDFKSKEELQLMPQTMEEHLDELEDQASENEDVSFSSIDEDNVHETQECSIDPQKPQIVSTLPASASAPRLQTLARSPVIKNTVYRSQSLFCDDMNPEKNSLHSSGQTAGKENGFVNTDISFEYTATPYKKKKSPLRLGKKIYEFYNAPITKFWFYTMTYFMFLMLFTFHVLVKTYPNPTWQEYSLIVYTSVMAMEKIRQVIASEPVRFRYKVKVFSSQYWNLWDSFAIMTFFIAVGLRFHDDTRKAARIVYTLNIVFWYIRILEILSVNKYLGPYVKIIGKLLRDMTYFLVIMLLVVASFGIVRQAIHFQNEDPSWFLVRSMFFYPYWMIYGELFADEIDTCTDKDRHDDCVYGSWVAPLCMFVFLLIANILLVNLLIARFNATFIRTNPLSRQIWKFQRYQLILNYELRPILPPPITFISHIYLSIKYLVRRCRGKRDFFDNGLKLFLSMEDKEKLHDFEEECMEDLFRCKEIKFQSSSEERIRNINERVENVTLRMDDVNQKENSIKLSLQTMDYRMSKLEDIMIQNSETLNMLRVFLARGGRHISTSSVTSSHGPVESQDSIVEHDYPMPDSPAKMDTENQQSPSGLTLRADSSFHTPSDANSTMRSIPSPLLVHSKKHVKDDTLRKFTDYSRHGKGKHKIEKSGSMKGKRILPRLSESSPTREEKPMIERSLHDRRHVQQELVVDIDKANSLVTDTDTHVVEKEFIGPNLNQSSSVYTTAAIPTEFFLSSQGNDETEFDMSQYKSIENAVYMRPAASPRRHNSGGSLGMPKTSSASFPAILTSQSSEYTTITDEIDTSCIIDNSPPRSPSTAGSFFADGYNDCGAQRRSSVVTSEENARLKQAEDLEHRKMERVIRHRLRQISLDDTDSISDIARLVVSELQTNEEDHSGHDEDPDDIHGSMESVVTGQIFQEVIEIKVRRPSSETDNRV